MSETLRRFGRALVVTLFAIVVVATVAPHPIGGHVGIALVKGTSMLPTYETGDLVVAVGSRSYGEGDVIVYESGRGQVIHRIVGGDATNGFLTQGDNRAEIDEWTPATAAIVGRPVLHLPGVGGMVAGLRDALGPNGLLLLAMFAFMLAARPRRRRGPRAWRDNSREAALGAAAMTVLAAASLILVARIEPAAWSLPVSRDALFRIAVLVVLLGAQATVVAIIVGRSGHIQLRTFWSDLTLGSRVVDADSVDLGGRALIVAASAKELRTAADQSEHPIFRATNEDGSIRYSVVGPDTAVIFDPAAPPALPFRRRTEPA